MLAAVEAQQLSKTVATLSDLNLLFGREQHVALESVREYPEVNRAEIRKAIVD